MELVQILQIVFIFVSFLLTILFVLIPICLIPIDAAKLSIKRTQRIIDFGNCFAGGVFLGTCFIQLIPQVEQKFRDAFTLGELPIMYCSTLTQFVAMIGFFLVLFLEQIVKVCQRGDRVGGTTSQRQREETQEMVQMKSYIVTVSSSQSDSDSEAELVQERKKMLKRPLKSASSRNMTSKKQSNPARSKSDRSLVGNESKNGIVCSENASSAGSSSIERRMRVSSASSSRHSDHCAMDRIIREDFSIRCFVLLLVLSIHSLFEGVAVGLQDDIWALVSLAIGISVHGCLMAFALGLSLARQSLKRSTVYKIAITFSATLPVGIAIGIAIELLHAGHGFVSSLVSAVLQGLTAGTFIYVIFFDILPVEVDQNRDRMLKVFVTFAGFSIICLLRFATAQHH